MKTKFCYLAADGVTDTKDEVLSWAGGIIAQAKAELRGQITAHLWSFRHPAESPSELLGCDFSDTAGGQLTITFTPGFPYDFFGFEPKVPDMAEAVHMAGLLIHGLDAKTVIGRRR